jgi:DNA-binding LytR/AlgR family response regulator
MPDENTIRCLIVDDEPPAREIIRRYIEAIPGLVLAGECANAIQVLGYLQKNQVDLIFLDINMPQLKGNEFLKILKSPPKIIFTTAHAEYALEGYELDVVDYLLKPIQFDRFVKAVQKMMSITATGIVVHKNQPEANAEAFIYFRADRKMIKVLLKDILYIESMKDYIKVFTKNNGAIITKQSMTSVEAMLPEDHFIRIHRSYIVSLSNIKSFTHEVIEVEKKEIPIGKLFRNNVLRMLQ